MGIYWGGILVNRWRAAWNMDKVFSHLRLLLPILLIIALLLPAVSPLRVSAAGENWLTGWDYRQEISIIGSTDGPLATYALNLTAHYGETSYGDPVGLGWQQT